MSADKPSNNKTEATPDTSASDKLRAEASTEQRSSSTAQSRTEGQNKDDRAMSKPDAMPRESDAQSGLSRRDAADLRYLHDNWKKLVEDNAKLNDKQKNGLKSSLELLENGGTDKIADFRKLVSELGRLGTVGGADVQARVDAISKIAETMANYPNAVNISAERVIGAKNIAALSQVAESFAQSAPYEENAPRTFDGKPSTTGDGYEHVASSALQQALRNKAAVDKMVESGKLPPGDWVFVPAAKGSVADDLKIDGMLVDLKSGKATFIDFAMHQGGRSPYRTLENKLTETYRNGTVKHPWGLTLDNDSIGWNPRTGELTGQVKTEQILERLGSYLKGTQAQDLGLNARQNVPLQFDIAGLKNDLGGRFPNFAPVNGNLEANIQSNETGQSVKTRLAELGDIATNKNSARPELRLLGMAAEAAKSAAEDVNNANNFFNQGLRAAVEADKYGARGRVYGDGKTVPDVNISIGTDNSIGLPEKYAGRPFIKIMGDDSVGDRGERRAPTEFRVYQNGDVVVKPGGGEFHSIGNIRELGGKLAREMQKNGVDPQQFNSQIRELSRVGSRFDGISKDLEDVKSGKMSAEKFWDAHSELRLIADGIGHAKASERAAQEGRPVYEARQQIDRSAQLASLPDADKNAIAERSVQLEKAGLKQSSFEDVQRIIKLESLGMKTPDAIDALSFRTAMGKDAEKWGEADLKTNFESAKELQANDHPNVKDLTEVFRIGQLQNDLKVEPGVARALFKIKGLMPGASNVELMNVKQTYDALKGSIKSLSYEDAAGIFSTHGKLTQPVIDDMIKSKNLLKDGLKAEDLAALSIRNVQVEARYAVVKGKADAIRAAVPDLLKAGVPLENAHDTAALMQTKKMNQADATQLAKTIAELRGSQNFGSFDQVAGSARILQSSAALSPESIRGEFRSLLAEGLSKHGSDMKGLRQFLEERLFERGTGGGGNEKDWAKAFDSVSRSQNDQDLARSLGLPDGDAERRQAIEGYKKLFGLSETGTNVGADAARPSAAQIESQLRGTQTFERLTDQQRMTDALKQLTDRALQRMPESNAEKGEFLTKQVKAAMRKQLGVATDAELPEAVKNMQVRIIDGDGAAPRLVQTRPGDPAVLEVPAKLLQHDAKSVLVDAYAHASGLGMLDLLHEKGNHAITIRSLEPMLSKIASQAEKIVGARSLAIATQERPAVSTETASSDRRIVLDPQKPLLTAWDGENLSFGGERFHVQTEVDKLQKDRESRVKDLDEKYRQAKELAESTKNAEDIARAQALETQLAAERQNLRVVSELRLAMSGQRGQSAQDRARSLVKAAADRAIDERLNGRERGGAPVSRAAAIAMVVSSLAFMYFGANGPAQADTYTGSFH
jgi:hypothetical protein